MAIRWTTAFLDYPAAAFEQGSAFWQAVTGSGLSATRGPQAEFATLLPANGDAFLRVQRLQAGPASCHLDIHADDVAAEAAQAERLGAAAIGQPDGYVVLRSPGGLSFCVVRHDGENERPPPERPGGYSSLVDQLSVDIPLECYDRECAFWSRLTGWPLTSASRPEFTFLSRPEGMPLRLLLQRLDEPLTGRPGCTAHLDLACDDVPAEQARHESLGATVVRVTAGWTTLRDPAGLLYCITRRDPATGKI
ncbi:MAG TPA: VOC family protein [Streptosporangiaceae bacterium]|nr:VOC family protein [Streptosporangiaceae bacterium]